MSTENIPSTIEVVQYKTLAGDIERAESLDSKATFNYADKKGNAEARSHVFGLRKVKAGIERARKEAKAYVLELGKQIDGQAKSMESRVQVLINRHEIPLLAIEEKEKERKAALQMRVDAIIAFGANRSVEIMSGKVSSKTLADSLAKIEALPISADDFAELVNAATTAKQNAVQSLNEQIIMAQQQEEARAEAKRQADELTLLKREAEEAKRQREIEEAKRQAEAKAKAEAEAQLRHAAEEKARLEREAIQREADAKMAAERAELRRLQEAEIAKKREEEAHERAKEEAARVEREKIAAAAQAKADQEAAVARAKAEAEAEAQHKETERLAAEAKIKTEQEARARDESAREVAIEEIAVSICEVTRQTSMVSARLIARSIVAGDIVRVKATI